MRLSHVRLLVDRFEDTFAFYRDVVGLPTKFPGEGPYAEFSLGADTYLGLFERALMSDAIGAAPAARAGETFVLCIQVGSVDAEVERMRSLGITVVAEPADRPAWGLRTAHVSDPEGNLVELYEDRPLEQS